MGKDCQQGLFVVEGKPIIGQFKKTFNRTS